MRLATAKAVERGKYEGRLDTLRPWEAVIRDSVGGGQVVGPQRQRADQPSRAGRKSSGTGLRGVRPRPQLVRQSMGARPQPSRASSELLGAHHSQNPPQRPAQAAPQFLWRRRQAHPEGEGQRQATVWVSLFCVVPKRGRLPRLRPMCPGPPGGPKKRGWGGGGGTAPSTARRPRGRAASAAGSTCEVLRRAQSRIHNSRRAVPRRPHRAPRRRLAH